MYTYVLARSPRSGHLKQARLSLNSFHELVACFNVSLVLGMLKLGSRVASESVNEREMNHDGTQNLGLISPKMKRAKNKENIDELKRLLVNCNPPIPHHTRRLVLPLSDLDLPVEMGIYTYLRGSAKRLFVELQMPVNAKRMRRPVGRGHDVSSRRPGWWWR